MRSVSNLDFYQLKRIVENILINIQSTNICQQFRLSQHKSHYNMKNDSLRLEFNLDDLNI